VKRSGVVSLAVAAFMLMAAALGARVAEQRQASREAGATLREGETRAFAASMRGTQPDGRLTVRQSALVPDAELLHLFEYFLSAQGEKALDQIVAAIGEELRQQLSSSPEALAQAERLLGRYLSYKRALLELEQAELDSSLAGRSSSRRLQARFERVRQLRSQFFSAEEASAFFRLDELRDAEAIRRLAVFEDQTLSLVDKQVALAQLELVLPGELLGDREASRRPQSVEQSVALMRSAGASDQDIQQFRTLHFSPDAARRLQQLDRDEQAWAGRLRQYEVEARQLLQLPDGPLRLPATLPPAQQMALEALRGRHFSPREQRRLAAYEVRG